MVKIPSFSDSANVSVYRVCGSGTLLKKERRYSSMFSAHRLGMAKANRHTAGNGLRKTHIHTI
jgi:hypothetical protein